MQGREIHEEPLQWHRGRFKNAYELLSLTALKISTLYKNRISQLMYG